jgi:hypothetical protein
VPREANFGIIGAAPLGAASKMSIERVPIFARVFRTSSIFIANALPEYRESLIE